MHTNRFRINPRVVHETIDGEVILIQIETGYYYSLGGSGAAIWELLLEGHPLDAVSDALTHGFGADRATVADAVAGLAGELRTEGLLEPLADDAPPVEPPSVNGLPPTPFAPPVLERYEDMQDFLLVDPIHEVEETGWPHKKPA